MTAVRDDGGLDVAPLLGAGPDGPTLGERMVLPASYVAEHLALAYASTVHAAQGQTVDSSHAVVTSWTSLAALYVALSRGRDANTAHVATVSAGRRPRPGLRAAPAAPRPGRGARRAARGRRPDRHPLRAGDRHRVRAGGRERAHRRRAARRGRPARRDRTHRGLARPAHRRRRAHRRAAGADRRRGRRPLARPAAAPRRAGRPRPAPDPRRRDRRRPADRGEERDQRAVRAHHRRRHPPFRPRPGRPTRSGPRAPTARSGTTTSPRSPRRPTGGPPSWAAPPPTTRPHGRSRRWARCPTTGPSATSGRSAPAWSRPTASCGATTTRRPTPSERRRRPGRSSSTPPTGPPGARSADPRSTGPRTNCPTGSSACASARGSANRRGDPATSATSWPAPARPPPTTTRRRPCAAPRPTPPPTTRTGRGCTRRRPRPRPSPRRSTSAPTQLQQLDDARAVWLAHTAATRAAAEEAEALLAERHADDAEPEPVVTAEEWLAAHRAAVAEDERHREIADDDVVDDRDRAGRDDTSDAHGRRAGRHPRGRRGRTPPGPARTSCACRPPTSSPTRVSAPGARSPRSPPAPKRTSSAEEDDRSAELARWHDEDQAVDEHAAVDEPVLESPRPATRRRGEPLSARRRCRERSRALVPPRPPQRRPDALAPSRPVLDEVGPADVELLRRQVLGLDQLLVGASPPTGRRRRSQSAPARLVLHDRPGQPPARHRDRRRVPVRRRLGPSARG